MYSPSNSSTAAVTNSPYKVSLPAFHRPRFLSLSAFYFEECMPHTHLLKHFRPGKGFLRGLGGVNIGYADLQAGYSSFYFPSAVIIDMVFIVSLLKWIIKEFHNGMLN